VQEGPPSPPFDQFYQQAIPAHTVQIHGVEYAWIYEVPPRLEAEVPAAFGPHIHLRGFDWLSEPARGQPLPVQLTWETRHLPDRNYWLFAHLLGPDGQRYDQIDMPYPTTDWTPGRFVKTNLPLTIPEDAPAASYRVLIGLYDPESGQRLPLTSEHAADPALGGANALLLTRLELE
jgi:heme/copper-type cytochrome/quinol oxidase subunit 2